MPLPYFEARVIQLGPLPIHPFGVLVAAGTLVGSTLAVRRSVKRGLDAVKAEQFVTFILICGFVGAHVLDLLMYRPLETLRDPLQLLYVWRGIGSFGGFVGAIIGLVLWRNRTKAIALPYADQVAAVFPISWLFGRSGCTLAHDHVGRLSDSPLAFNFPPGMYHPSGPRLDLGFLELLLTIPIALAMLAYASKPRRAGSIVGLLCILYAPIRFPLDALRATDIAFADARYVGLTPAQWLSVALFAAGVWLMVQSRKHPIIGNTPELPAAAADVPASTQTS